MVYSKRENSSIWKEPAIMTGQENRQILLVKYSKAYLKVHALWLHVKDVKTLSEIEIEIEKEIEKGQTKITTAKISRNEIF